MDSGSTTVTRGSLGGFTYSSDVLYSKSWTTDLYAYQWQSFTIRMMMDFRYEYWELIFWGTPINFQQKWICERIRGGTLGLAAPYPDIGRDKTLSDDTVILNPRQTKYLTYGSLVGSSFSFDVGVNLKKVWAGQLANIELDVPIIAVSHLGGHYASGEAVYRLTSTANYEHTWEIYEFGYNYGTVAGWVPTFSLYD
jgi:hypothetical protein